jgi:trimeric autotransporter adhesin
MNLSIAVLRRSLLALALLLLSGLASAQNWTQGQAYESQCAGCHRSGGLANPLTGRTPSLTAVQLYNGIHSNSIMSSYYSWTVTNELADLAYYLANPNGPPTLAPVASLSPTTLNFGNQTQSIASAPLTATLRNTGTANLVLSSLTVAGANAAEFTRGGTCAAGTLAPSASCTISVTFTPAAIGTRSASISIAHNAAGSPTVLALTGVGVVATTLAPVIAISPSALDFGTVPLMTTTAARTVTVSNTGNAPMAISALQLAGSNPGDFAQTTTCSLTTPLAAGSQCTISVTFTPSAAGSRSATLTVVSNATGANSVTLRGSGATVATTGPAAGLSTSAIDFGSRRIGNTSSARRIRVTSTGGAALSISAITASGDFAQVNDCPALLAPGATCTVKVRFAPTAVGPRTGELAVNSNAAGSPHRVALTGTGLASRTGTATTTVTDDDECDDDSTSTACSALVSPLGKAPAKR